MLPAIDPVFFGFRRDLDALDAAVRRRVRPRVWFLDAGTREADLRQDAVLVVVLPAIDAAVLVAVDSRADRTGAVHLGPGVDAAVAIRIEGELLQPSGLVVVGRFGRGLEAVRVAA